MRRICTYGVLMCLGIIILLGNGVQAAVISDFVVPRNFVFSKEMRLGTSTSPDVYYMQNILNMSTSTRVANTGPGSNKELTVYYGEKTKDAVGRFQKVFAEDIAYEKSLATTTASSSVASSTQLSSTTVDVFTRAVLNKLVIIYNDDRDLYIKSLTGIVPTESAVEEAPAEEPASAPAPASQNSNTSSGSNNSSSNSNSSMPSLTDKPEAFIYKNKKLMFTYSPQGQLLKAIGGSELVDQVFSYTPAGIVGGLTGQGGAGSNSGGGAAAGALGLGALGGAAGGASASTVVQNFGGVSTSMTTCTCSSNLLIYVQDVRGMTLPLIYQPGVTTLYQYYSPRSGVNMLGQYTSGGQCLVYAGTTCSTGGTPIGTMTQLGTSLTIAK